MACPDALAVFLSRFQACLCDRLSFALVLDCFLVLVCAVVLAFDVPWLLYRFAKHVGLNVWTSSS